MFDSSPSDFAAVYESAAGAPPNMAGLISVVRAVGARAVLRVATDTAAAARRAQAAEHKAAQLERQLRAALATVRKARRAPVKAAPRTLTERVAAVAGALPRTVAELARAAGVTPAQAQGAVQRLTKAGKLKRSGARGSFAYCTL